MKLHDDKKLFKEAVQITAQQLGIPEIYIEKDYWVTYALHTIFHDAIGAETVFKGGTALSKCFGLIDRFSEDIDLVVLRSAQESNNHLTNKIKKISTAVTNVLPEVTIENVTRKMGMNRKTAHTYNKEFKGEYGQVRDVIIVEATWLGYFEPYVTKDVKTYIYNMMLETDQSAMIEKFGLQPFEVKVLDPKRSICEKIMSLVRFSYTASPIDDLKAKIRHVYDLHKLLEDNPLKSFFDSKEFDELLVQVANDDVNSYPNNNQWLENAPHEAMIFDTLDTVWKELEPVYNGQFKDLVFGELPKASDVLATLQAIKERLLEIEWTVSIKTREE